MPNPFFFNGTIINPDYFVGREKELKKIFGYLDVTHTGQIQHVSVVGERRIGKSSLLQHINQVYPKYLTDSKNYRFVFVDMQSAHHHQMAGLFHNILAKLDLPAPSNPTLEKFVSIIEQAREKSKIWPVLLFDEFEYLPEHNHEFPETFFDALRSLGGNNTIGLVTASKCALIELQTQNRLVSNFFNIFHQIDLGEFSDTEAQALLDKGRTSDQRFSEDDCAQIVKIAGHHPAKLQVVASLVYEAKTGGKIDWKAVKSEAFKEPPFVTHSANNKKDYKWFLKPVIWLFWDAPQMLGHAILVFIKRTEGTNAATDRFWGYVVIAIPILIYFGVISLPLVTKIIRRVAELFQ